MKQAISDKELLLLVETQPGITATQVADFYDVTHSAASGRMARLYSQGKLNRRKTNPKGVRGVTFGYFPPNGDVPEPAPLKRKTPTENGWQARFEVAQETIRELMEWREEALRRFPDLAVPDIVRRARQIVAKAAPEHRAEALDGRLDKKPIMLATIAALEEVS
jgi:hypothetical protein